MQAEELFKAFADKTRLRIISSLIKEPKFVEQLALELNISVSTVSFHLKKLLAAGIVSAEKQQYYQVYFVDRDVLRLPISDLIESEDEKCDNAFYERVKKQCFENGRVKKLPVQIRWREVIYSEVAKTFSYGKGYTEGEANVKIAEIVEDFMTAKSEMINSGVLVKKGNKIYKG